MILRCLFGFACFFSMPCVQAADPQLSIESVEGRVLSSGPLSVIVRTKSGPNFIAGDGALKLILDDKTVISGQALGWLNQHASSTVVTVQCGNDGTPLFVLPGTHSVVCRSEWAGRAVSSNTITFEVLEPLKSQPLTGFGKSTEAGAILLSYWLKKSELLPAVAQKAAAEVPSDGLRVQLLGIGAMLTMNQFVNS